jgi:hypothetical protein
MAHHDGTIVAEGSTRWPACRLTGDQIRSCLRRLVAEGSSIVTATAAGDLSGHRGRIGAGRCMGTPGWPTPRARPAGAGPHLAPRRLRHPSHARPAARATTCSTRRRRDPERLTSRPIAGRRTSRRGPPAGRRRQRHRHHRRLDIGASTTPHDRRRLWPIEAVAAKYQAFVDVYEGAGRSSRCAATSAAWPRPTSCPAARHRDQVPVLLARSPAPTRTAPPWPGRGRDLIARSGAWHPRARAQQARPLRPSTTSSRRLTEPRSSQSLGR